MTNSAHCAFGNLRLKQQQAQQHNHTTTHNNSQRRRKRQQKSSPWRLRFNRRGATTPFWEVESCSLPKQAAQPNPSHPALCRQDTTISMEHRLRRTHVQLNSDAIASNETLLKETQEKRKKKNFFHRKTTVDKRKKTNEKHESEVTLKWAIPDPPCPPRPNNRIFTRENRNFYNSNFLLNSTLVVDNDRQCTDVHTHTVAFSP